MVSEEDPVQSLPPPDGAGFVHVLVLDCCPVPHVLEHVEYAPHALHIPLTEKYCIGNKTVLHAIIFNSSSSECYL